jgi:hypothetical protein
LTECAGGAAHEDSACERGREPERLHNSDELTNFAGTAQQNVRGWHRDEKTGEILSFPAKGEATVYLEWDCNQPGEID